MCLTGFIHQKVRQTISEVLHYFINAHSFHSPHLSFVFWLLELSLLFRYDR